MKSRPFGARKIPRPGDVLPGASRREKEVTVSEKIRLLIVDDHAVVREGLQAMLAPAPGIDRIATASCGADAEMACAARAPHVILLDVRMPGSDGFHALEAILRRWPQIRIIMLSASATTSEVKLARQHGAAGYLSKSADRVTLLRAIQTVADGGTCFQADPAPAATAGPVLSARELEVLQHLGRGLGNDELGRVLGVSGETIKSHLKAIFGKLGVAARAEAVTRGYELGLLSVP